MKTRERQALYSGTIVVVVVAILILTSYFLLSYSTSVSCTGMQSVPRYIVYFKGTTISSATQTIVQQVNTTARAGYGHVGSVYSTRVSYTTVVTISGSSVTLNGGYANETCTYDK